MSPDGTVIPNSELTKPSDFKPRSYAFCSDTAYNPSMLPQIKGVTLLYHEATFCEEEAAQAAATGHSTSRQAAQIAKEEDTLLTQAREVFPDTVLSNEGVVFIP